MKTKTVETILITKQSEFYQPVGEAQVGFTLSPFHNHAIILTEYFSWDDPWKDGGFWGTAGRKYETYPDHANMNDQETQSLIENLTNKNVKFNVDSKIIEELKIIA